MEYSPVFHAPSVTVMAFEFFAIRDFCRSVKFYRYSGADPGFMQGGPSRDFADIAQQSCGSGKNLGLKMGGEGGGPGPQAPPRSAPGYYYSFWRILITKLSKMPTYTSMGIMGDKNQAYKRRKSFL